TELVLNAPLALAAAAMTARSRQRQWTGAFLCAIAAGAATGIAALFKYQAALAGVAWLASLWIERPRTRVAAGAAGLALGFTLVAVALVGGFAATGHLDDFLFWGWRYNFAYIAAVPVPRQIERFATEAAPLALMWAPILLMALASRRRVMLAWLWA